jgi:hypothetical protein
VRRVRIREEELELLYGELPSDRSCLSYEVRGEVGIVELRKLFQLGGAPLQPLPAGDLVAQGGGGAPQARGRLGVVPDARLRELLL